MMYDSGDSYASGGESEGYDSYYSEGEVPSSQTQQPKSRSWTIIDAVKLAHIQEEALNSVTSILNCSRSDARNLLMHYRWDTESLFGALADKGEDNIFRAAGVTSRASESTAQPRGEEVTCGTCFCEVPIAEATSMECGHCFCNDCWGQHFNIQIREGKSRRLKCMAVRCGAHCDEDKVKKLIMGDEVLLGKYQDSLLSSYIEDNAMVRWCPSVPHCGNAVRAETDPHCEPSCSCGMRFCFACSDEPHSPCTCEMWKQWKQKCQDDSETKHWLTANTKPCPKCGKPVEKNGGCNLVTCHCGQSFCWLCGVSTGRSHTWTEIHGHSCGRYRDEADKRIDEAVRNVKRYQHYFTRWEGHVKSAKLEGQQRAAVQEKIGVLEEKKTTLKDYTWLLQALDQLYEARRILGYSYAFAFYMFGNSMFKEEITEEQNDMNKNLFENQQQDIEGLIEHLSLKLEIPADKMTEVEDSLRLEVINHTVNLDKRLEKLYELIENDLLGNLMFSPNYIAPYKGCSSLKASVGGQTIAMATKDGEVDEAVEDNSIINLTNSPTPSPGTRSPGKRPRLEPARGRLRA